MRTNRVRFSAARDVADRNRPELRSNQRVAAALDDRRAFVQGVGVQCPVLLPLPSLASARRDGAPAGDVAVPRVPPLGVGGPVAVAG